MREDANGKNCWFEFTVPAEHKGVNEFQFLSSKVRGEVREMIILKDIKQSLMPQTEG